MHPLDAAAVQMLLLYCTMTCLFALFAPAFWLEFHVRCIDGPVSLACLASQASQRFLLIQAAWETLRDEDLRREYDCRLDLQARNVVVSDEVCVKSYERIDTSVL